MKNLDSANIIKGRKKPSKKMRWLAAIIWILIIVVIVSMCTSKPESTDTIQVIEGINVSTLNNNHIKVTKLTNAIDNNKYVSLIINIEEIGLSLENDIGWILGRVNDFLYQESLNGAEKVGININIKDSAKILMFEVDMKKFKAAGGTTGSGMIYVIQTASFEMIDSRIKEYIDKQIKKYK